MPLCQAERMYIRISVRMSARMSVHMCVVMRSAEADEVLPHRALAMDRVPCTSSEVHLACGIPTQHLGYYSPSI